MLTAHRLFIKAALVYLALTMLTGVAFWILPLFGGPYLGRILGTTHGHLGVVGFVLFMIMGVGYWMFPRPGGFKQESWSLVNFHVFNTGMVLRVVAEPIGRAWPNEVTPWVLGVSGLLHLAGVGMFVGAAWKRIASPGFIQKLSARRPGSAGE
jgi:hypothetical protein